MNRDRPVRQFMIHDLTPRFPRFRPIGAMFDTLS